MEYGTGIESMDYEGRNIRLDFKEFSVMSLYLPSGTNLNRLQHKLEYMDMFQDYINSLRSSFGNLIIAGDYNICHRAIDIHDPIRNKNVSGFLPVEREWLQNFIDSGFIDSFRYFSDAPHTYSWCSYRANSRSNNKRWRIDYIMVANGLNNHLINSNILNNVFHSDHCPISVELDI